MSLGEWLLAFAKLVLLMVFNVRLCRVFQPLAPLPPPPAPIEFGLLAPRL